MNSASKLKAPAITVELASNGVNASTCDQYRRFFRQLRSITVSATLNRS